MKTDWEQLSKEQKVKYKSYCDKKFGKTIMFDEAGEPMYLDENCDMIDTSIIIKLLFYTNNN